MNEQLFIANLHAESTTPRWLGGLRDPNTNTWTFTDGTPFVQSNLLWFDGEPNNMQGKENCLSQGHNIVSPNHALNDADCTTTRRYVCEWCPAP